MDIQILERIVIECQSHPHPIVFKPLYLLCFFSFLRLSNILPHSIRTFDHTRQLARGDFIPSQAGAVVLLKWSKTIQDRKTTQTIPLPHLEASPLCPLSAILAMTHEIVAKANDPLFIVPSPNQVPLTDSVARKHLKKISTALHAFRRAHYETWHLEVRCHLVLPILFSFPSISCFPCLSVCPTFVILLGVWVLTIPSLYRKIHIINL